MTKATWIEFGRQPGETDEEWSAVCKEMAAFLQAQQDDAESDAPEGDA